MSLSVEQDSIHCSEVGISINVNITSFPEEIRDIATSLYLESGQQR